MAEAIAESEYSAQYFGFTPEMFFHQFCELILDEMSLVCQHSMKQLSSLENNDALIKDSLAIHKRWSARSEHILKDLQPVIKEFFTIPKNVLLPSDEVYAFQYIEEEIKNLEEEIKQLKEKYIEELKSVQMYKTELDILENLEPIKRKVDEGIDKLNKFTTTVQDVREIEKIAQTFNAFRKGISETNDDDHYEIGKRKFGEKTK
ncbi:hypothetical protein ILUMI_26934 [Ignelater luminosus]|uniref:Protein MIS12 homolog n=1 Tax=Ignelater luminosus TaxID=2038154 RepID=A0A8K0C7I6_IGNLU|nr:hypothetical protein ILUMI_26934 [Ignelater luminosus]